MHGAWDPVCLLHRRRRGDHGIACNSAVFRAGNAVGVLHGGGHGHLYDLECVVHGRANAMAMLSRCGNGKLHREFVVYRLPNAVAVLYRRGNGNLLELAPGCNVYQRWSAAAVLQRPWRGKLFEPGDMQTVPLGERL